MTGVVAALLSRRSFETGFNASGLQALVAQYGDWFSYDKNPRAQIFQRNQSLVWDVDSMIRLMRWVPPPWARAQQEPLLHTSRPPGLRQWSVFTSSTCGLGLACRCLWTLGAPALRTGVALGGAGG